MTRINRKGDSLSTQRPHRDVELVGRLKALGEEYPRYGCLMLHGMLRTEGVVENSKRTYRLCRELGLHVRTKRRCKLNRPRILVSIPSRPNERWSADFVHDQLADGRRIRILKIVDDYSRVCVGQYVDLLICGTRMARLLDELRQTRGLPKTLVLDNGPEMTSKTIFFWSRQSGVKLHFIQLGKPTRNAFVEKLQRSLPRWLSKPALVRRSGRCTTHHYGVARPLQQRSTTQFVGLPAAGLVRGCSVIASNHSQSSWAPIGGKVITEIRSKTRVMLTL
jgi:transposase InsO family protein